MRYQFIVVWEDCSMKDELTNDLSSALGAAQIYLMDPETAVMHIIDNELEEMVFNWHR